MSEFLKSGDFIGGAQFLNQVLDSTASGQPDVLGVLPGTAYGGGLNTGDYLRLTDKEALALSNTTVGTLYGGIYRRVFFKSGITGGGNTGFKRGQIVFWDLVTTTNPSEHTVTNVEATDPQLLAGIVINANDTSGAPISGNYGWIQVAGLATGLFTASSFGDGTVGNSVYWAKAGAGANNATLNAVLGSSSVTSVSFGEFTGIVVTAATSGGLSKVQLVGLSDRRI